MQRCEEECMIIEFNENNKEDLLNYIGDNFDRCPYVYIDLKKYELNKTNFKAWAQMNSDNLMTAVITEYFKGYQIFSKNNDFDKDELVKFLKEKKATVLFGVKKLMDKIKGEFNEHMEKPGIIGELKELKNDIDNNAYKAKESDIKDIVELLVKEKGTGEAYGFESLYKQYTERMKNKTGRNYILRDEDNKLICHAGTCAETDDMAVIGGVIVAPEYRGKGYAKGILTTVCKELLSEGKRVFSFFYIPSAIKIHYACGFEDVDGWIKLEKR